MSKTTNQLYNEARKLIEQWRYKYHCGDGLRLFIAYWAYLQSGMYPPEGRHNEQEFKEVAMPLTHVLSSLMMMGETDPLGQLLTEYTSSGKDNGFYPTPGGVVKLMSQLVAHGSDNSNGKSLYEPCAGTGSMTLSTLEERYFENIDKDSPLAGFTVLMEEKSGLMCNALFIQLAHKLQYLQMVGGKPAVPEWISIVNVDVLSRNKGNIHYFMSSPEAQELINSESEVQASGEFNAVM